VHIAPAVWDLLPTERRRNSLMRGTSARLAGRAASSASDSGSGSAYRRGPRYHSVPSFAVPTEILHIRVYTRMGCGDMTARPSSSPNGPLAEHPRQQPLERGLRVASGGAVASSRHRPVHFRGRSLLDLNRSAWK
jgi:hypothetical protein